MKIKLFLIALALLPMTQIYSSITERLATNSGKISKLKQDIASGKLDAVSRCEINCKGCKSTGN